MTYALLLAAAVSRVFALSCFRSFVFSCFAFSCFAFSCSRPARSVLPATTPVPKIGTAAQPGVETAVPRSDYSRAGRCRRRSSLGCHRLADTPLGRASTRPRFPSPDRMAIPSGSLLRALRVGSSRGSTLRTAPRGAGSGWMKRATGFIRPHGVITGIDGRLSP
jgi:hypothetical protein